MRSYDEFIKVATDDVDSYTVEPNSGNYQVNNRTYHADKNGRLVEKKRNYQKQPTQEDLKREHDEAYARENSYVDPYGEAIPKESFEYLFGMDKEAAARWKKEFGNLSETAKDTLKKNVAKSSEDMVKGIERGNKELIRKLGEKGQLKGVVSHRNLPAIYKHIKQGIGKNDGRAMNIVRTIEAALSGPATLWSERHNDGGTKLISGMKKSILNKDRYKITGAAKRSLYIKDKELGRMSRSDKRAVDAITLRHELDEARSMSKRVNEHPYSTHNAPDVVHRESANLALMPEKVKRAFTNMRKDHSFSKHDFINQAADSVYGGHRVGGEYENLGKRGVKYGDSPYLDKRKMRSHANDALAGKDSIEPWH